MKTARSNNDLQIDQEAPIAGTLLLIVGIIFIATNLRSPLTSVGPLTGTLREHLGISNLVIGLITTIPLLAFALFSSLAPKLSRQIGAERLLFVSLIILTAGIAVRSMAGEATLFMGTILIGISISVCNVLIPSLIKRDFGQKVGLMTGIFSVSMNLCGAIASGISIPLADGMHFGWHGAMGVWGLLSLVSIFLWLPQVRKMQSNQTSAVSETSERETNIWKSPLAWYVTFFMGFQSLIFYVTVTWLPEILVDQGFGMESSGWMLSFMQLAVLPFTFIVPILADRLKNQKILVIITALLFLLGMLGLLYGGRGLALISVILIGVGVGSSFSLAMMFFSLRTKTAKQSAGLSGMAQSVGYLLAAAGPTLFGILHTMTKNWTAPIYMIIISAIFLLITGLKAGSNKFIDEK
ncbi:CynX/NimT family MFS transporter [Metabacillus sp. RGM 3146]|uniref:CynX/NimT family MFS transporter n=1 Tax=Metabacillus sp. RGM 3146 TaxID=3401092 RepID=UPI003B98F961